MHLTVVRKGDEQAEFEIATSVLTSVLAGVPTTLGKLAWISAFRVPDSDEYAHPALDQLVCHKVAVRAARTVHERRFYDWLGLGLQAQLKDLVL
jgi:hypothetical protein